MCYLVCALKTQPGVLLAPAQRALKVRQENLQNQNQGQVCFRDRPPLDRWPSELLQQAAQKNLQKPTVPPSHLKSG